MSVQRRVYQLEDLGVEVFFPGRASLYLTLKTSVERDAFIKALMQQPSLQLEHMRRWGGCQRGDGMVEGVVAGVGRRRGSSAVDGYSRDRI